MWSIPQSTCVFRFFSANICLNLNSEESISTTMLRRTPIFPFPGTLTFQHFKCGRCITKWCSLSIPYRIQTDRLAMVLSDTLNFLRTESVFFWIAAEGLLIIADLVHLSWGFCFVVGGSSDLDLKIQEQPIAILVCPGTLKLPSHKILNSWYWEHTLLVPCVILLEANWIFSM